MPFLTRTLDSKTSDRLKGLEDEARATLVAISLGAVGIIFSIFRMTERINVQNGRIGKVENKIESSTSLPEMSPAGVIISRRIDSLDKEVRDLKERGDDTTIAENAKRALLKAQWSFLAAAVGIGYTIGQFLPHIHIAF